MFQIRCQYRNARRSIAYAGHIPDIPRTSIVNTYGKDMVRIYVAEARVFPFAGRLESPRVFLYMPAICRLYATDIKRLRFWHSAMSEVPELSPLERMPKIRQIYAVCCARVHAERGSSQAKEEL